MQYAYFDPNTRMILSWIDTETHNVVLPDQSMLIEVTPEQWSQQALLGWVTAELTLSISQPLPSEAEQLLLAQTRVFNDLEEACAAQIVKGFTSRALGEAFTYPAKQTDQMNLQASVLASLLPGVDEGWSTPFWCADSSGEWAYRDHSAAQIQQVGIDGKNAINAAIAQKIVLEQQVEAVRTAAEVAAIAWPQDEVAA
ncbi:hypothetical protein [Pseudomonas sp.]|uniref:DUF4376 domain-containing protein n=1 Tax=Pseudomonas sp. TaxID=306 RepID=UPI0028AA8403|nr:hypothetical protein [Pseudomonas sp.]